MAFNKQALQQALEDGFAKIGTEASADRPATKIVAETIAAALQKVLEDAEVTATAVVGNETINIKGTIK